MKFEMFLQKHMLSILLLLSQRQRGGDALADQVRDDAACLGPIYNEQCGQYGHSMDNGFIF